MEFEDKFITISAQEYYDLKNVELISLVDRLSNTHDEKLIESNSSLTPKNRSAGQELDVIGVEMFDELIRHNVSSFRTAHYTNAIFDSEVHFAENCLFDCETIFDGFTTFDELCMFGDNTTFGDDCIFVDGFSYLGEDSTFGNDCHVFEERLMPGKSYVCYFGDIIDEIKFFKTPVGIYVSVYGYHDYASSFLDGRFSIIVEKEKELSEFMYYLDLAKKYFNIKDH